MTEPVIEYQLTMWRDAAVHADMRLRECEELYTEAKDRSDRAKQRLENAQHELEMIRASLADCQSRQASMVAAAL